MCHGAVLEQLPLPCQPVVPCTGACSDGGGPVAERGCRPGVGGGTGKTKHPTSALVAALTAAAHVVQDTGVHRG